MAQSPRIIDCPSVLRIFSLQYFGSPEKSDGNDRLIKLSKVAGVSNDAKLCGAVVSDECYLLCDCSKSTGYHVRIVPIPERLPV